MNKDTPIFVKAFIQHPCDDGSFDIMIEDTSGRPRFININCNQIHNTEVPKEEPKDDEGYYVRRPWDELNPPPTINNEPTRYYVRVKFSQKFFNGIPVKTDRLYRTYKDIIKGPVPGCVEGMIRIIDINGTSHEWNKEAIDEIKVYPQLEKVKEVEDDEPEKEFGGEYHV